LEHQFRKNCYSHIDASLSRQPLVKGERLVRGEVNAVMAVLDLLEADYESKGMTWHILSPLVQV
jgi:hypothetical protein